MRANGRRDGIAAALIVLAALAFLPGVTGNFQLDDIENLAPIQRLVAGDVTWSYAVFSNRSGMLGRPVAMASFAANALATGLSVAPFRLVNLLLHALCGLLAWRLAQRVVDLDPALQGARRWLGPLIGVAWVLLPIHVSTVLYVVQRMAVLSALFTLLALLAYLAGRQRAQEGRRGGWVLLFLAFPACAALAALSKENGLLAPLYALALELGCFGLALRRPAAIKLFHAAFLGVPALLALAWLALHPDFITAGYANRSFTLAERVLTEPRVLWDYVRGILLPVGSSLGVVQDDYPLSRSLLDPPTTLAAIAAWGAALWVALRCAARRPALSAGILFFLAGHAMESTVWPLEIRFDHRNYLPALGVLLATAGAAGALLQRLLPRRTRAFALAGHGLLACVVAAYAFATTARAALWSDEDALYRQMAAARPNSPRLQAILAARSMESGDLPGALGHIDAAERLQPDDALAPAVWRVLAHCVTATPVPAELVARIGEVDPGRLSLPAMKAIDLVASRAEPGDCPGLDRGSLAHALAGVLARTTASATDHGVWRVRYYQARLLAAESRWPEAIAAARQAWQDSDYNSGVGVLLFQLNASVEDKAACREVLERLRRDADPRDLALASALAQFQAFVDS